jgi:hypothetical protein
MPNDKTPPPQRLQIVRKNTIKCVKINKAIPHTSTSTYHGVVPPQAPPRPRFGDDDEDKDDTIDLDNDKIILNTTTFERERL